LTELYCKEEGRVSKNGLNLSFGTDCCTEEKESIFTGACSEINKVPSVGLDISYCFGEATKKNRNIKSLNSILTANKIASFYLNFYFKIHLDEVRRVWIFKIYEDFNSKMHSCRYNTLLELPKK